MFSIPPVAVGIRSHCYFAAGLFFIVSISGTPGAQQLVRHSADAVNGDYALDASGNNIHLELKGQVSASGGTLNFQSTATSSSTVARNAAATEILDDLDQYTITGWYNALNGPQGGRLLSLGNGDLLELFYVSNGSGVMNRIRLHADGGVFAQSGYSSTYALQAQWVFFAVAVDAKAASFGDGVKFYAGTESANTASVGLSGTGGSLTNLKTGNIGTLALGNVWNASSGTPGANRAVIQTFMDDVRVFAGTLNATEIENIRLSSATALVRYAADEGTGTTAADDGLDSLDVSLSNGMGWAADGVAEYGMALRNPAAASSSAAIAKNAATGTTLDNLSKYTITGWYRADDGPQGGRLLSLGGGDLLELFYIGNGSGVMNRIRLHADGGVFAQSGYSSTYALEDEWVFFAVSVDTTAPSFADGVRFYAGTESAGASSTGLNSSGGSLAGLNTGNISALVLGNVWNAAPGTPSANRSLVKTNLDDIRILAGALDATTIESIRQEAARAGSSLPADMARWTEADKTQQRADGDWLKQYLATQLGNGNRAISILPGHYRFSAPAGNPLSHVTLSGYGSTTESTVIDFQGSTLWFETKETGLLMSNCDRITIRNAFLDWDPLPFVQGRVAAFKPNNVMVIALDTGYYRLPAGTAGTGTWRGAVFDDAGHLKPGVPGFNGVFDWANREPDGTYRVWFQGFYGVSLANSGIAAGDRIALFSRTGRAVKLEGIRDCRFEDVTLHSSPFVAFSQTTGGNTTFLRCNVLRRPGTTRLMAGNADGIRCTNLAGGPTIDSCKLEALGDDFINVSGHLSRVLWQPNGPGTTTVICSKLNNRGNVTVPRLVKFFDRATWTPKGERMATMVASNYTINTDGSNCLADLGVQWNSGDAAKVAAGETVPSHALTLDSPITVTGDWIAVCEEFSSPGAVIRNSEFGGGIARGLRLQAPEVTVENNVIAETASFGISLSGDAGYWGEGPYVHSAHIEGNTIADSCMGQAVNSERAALLARQGGDFSIWHAQHDITITNNTFLRTGNQAIVARGVDDLTITGNSISAFANFPPYSYTSGNPPPGAGYPIVAEDCDGTRTISGNSISNPGPHANGSLPFIIP